MPKIAEQLKALFSGSDRVLLGLRLELNGQVCSWSTELFESEDYRQLINVRESLQHAKSNGGQGVRFYEKMERLCKIPLSTTLNVSLQKVDEVFESVTNELKNFA